MAKIKQPNTYLEKKMKQLINQFFILFFIFTSSTIFAEEDNEEVIDIKNITSEQRQSMGIITSAVNRVHLEDSIVAPGEVTMNAYQSSQVSTRISAQIFKRHTRMGDRVSIRQKLLTLSSVEMAEAQGELFVADREWQRVKKLGHQVVSEQRYIKAQVNRQQAYAKVLAYGMTDKQANNLLKKRDASKATGTFDLLSPQKGTIVSDSFVIGQVIEPGQLLMEISDETSVWVETKIRPEDVIRIKPDTVAIIYVTPNKVLKGKVIQIHRRLNETTRTLSIRIEVDNKHGLLHPGQFVKTALQTSMGTEVIAVPNSSVTLLHGEKVVFKLVEDGLQPQLVETGAVRSDWVEIKEGLQQGDNIVTKGMFLLKSLLLKSQIGDAD